jgi:two-component system sensor histidine kinase/response regulator
MNPLVLIIDSHPQCRLYELLADRIGISTHVVDGCAAAIQAVASIDFALILTDWTLPDGSGLDCQRHIREKLAARGRTIPIICVTARAVRGDREHCLSAGMDDYLSKPFTIEQLDAMVHKWIPRATG